MESMHSLRVHCSLHGVKYCKINLILLYVYLKYDVVTKLY